MAEIDLLSDKSIRAARPRQTAYKVADGRGMYLLVAPTGGKLWRLKYRLGGKERVLALGSYPDVGVAAARRKRDDARALIAKGVDPVADKHEKRDAKSEQGRFTFAVAANRYFDHNANGWSDTHQRDVRRILDELTASLGDKPLAAIEHEHVEACIAKIVKRDALSVARDTRLYFRCVIRHHNQKNRKHRIADPSAEIVIEKPPKVKHHPALTPGEVGAFLRKLQNAAASPLVRAATRMLLLTAVRTTELRKAEWSEIDARAKLWRIPANRMKAGVAHVVPLAPQTLDLLAQLRTISGEGDLLFPNLLNPHEPMSENAIIANIYRMGYSGTMTGHGARSTFSSWCNENGFSADAVERQLAHAPRDSVRAAYLHSEFLPERKELMDAWAAFLTDAERTNVVQIKGRA